MLGQFSQMMAGATHINLGFPYDRKVQPRKHAAPFKIAGQKPVWHLPEEVSGGVISGHASPFVPGVISTPSDGIVLHRTQFIVFRRNVHRRFGRSLICLYSALDTRLFDRPGPDGG